MSRQCTNVVIDQLDGEARPEQHRVTAGRDAQYPQECRVNDVELHQYQQLVELEVAGREQMDEVPALASGSATNPVPVAIPTARPIGRLDDTKYARPYQVRNADREQPTPPERRHCVAAAADRRSEHRGRDEHEGKASHVADQQAAPTPHSPTGANNKRACVVSMPNCLIGP